MICNLWYCNAITFYSSVSSFFIFINYNYNSDIWHTFNNWFEVDIMQNSKNILQIIKKNVRKVIFQRKIYRLKKIKWNLDKITDESTLWKEFYFSNICKFKDSLHKEMKKIRIYLMLCLSFDTLLKQLVRHVCRLSA